MKITIIAAIGNQRELGKDGDLLWVIPEDLKHFKQVTSGHAVLMGRKTYESIGFALPGRRNIVITSDVNYSAPGVEVIHSYDEIPNDIEELFVIGGEKLYKDFLDKADCMWITRVDGTFDADVFFPEFDKQKFTYVSDERRKRGKDEKENGIYDYWFEYWIRRPVKGE